MSVTGEADGAPVKVGAAVNDVMSGLNAAVAILSALRHRDRSGVGQHIDVALLDVQVGWLYNVGMNYLLSGQVPRRWGTAHPNTVPYQAFPTSDGHVIIGANNDQQFRRLCDVAGLPELAKDERFQSNAQRLEHRQELVQLLSDVTRRRQGRRLHRGHRMDRRRRPGGARRRSPHRRVLLLREAGDVAPQLPGDRRPPKGLRGPTRDPYPHEPGDACTRVHSAGGMRPRRIGRHPLVDGGRNGHGPSTGRERRFAGAGDTRSPRSFVRGSRTAWPLRSSAAG